MGEKDKVTVVSIIDSHKDYLMEKFQPKYIRKKYEELLNDNVY